MVKWKLFGKNKSEEDMECEQPKETEKQVLAEHRETLYAEGSAPKKKKGTKTSDNECSDQRVWRDVKSIERNVDTIDKNKPAKKDSELDRAVDKIIFRRKKK